jgi:hypothetical protein
MQTESVLYFHFIPSAFPWKYKTGFYYFKSNCTVKEDTSFRIVLQQN